MVNIINAIPTMTSNTAPSGIVSASSTSTTSAEYKAFNKVTTDYWQSGGSSAVPSWLRYDFSEPKVIVRYSILNDTVSLTAPKSWTFEGSNDGTNWTVLDTRTNFTGFQNNIVSYFDANNTVAYRYYRLYVTAFTGDASVNPLRINEMEMYEALFEVRMSIKNPTTSKPYSLDIQTLIHLPNTSDKNMILFGIEQGKEIQLDVPFDKVSYINDTPILNTRGKIFTHTVKKVNTINIKEVN